MFADLLKAKLEIESKVKSLQKTYFDLLSSPVREIEFNNENNLDSAKQILENKLEEIEKIKEEYQVALNQHLLVGAELQEAKETAEEIEDSLDSLFEALGIEVPEDLKKKTEEEVEQEASPQELDQENRQDNSNLQRFSDEEEEEEDLSDKENSILDVSHNSSGGYFSPNIQIQKLSLGPNSTNEALYTPAIKSTSKGHFFKRNL
jgi:hypothetical protein